MSKRQKGFTIIEIVIASAIFVTFMVVAISITVVFLNATIETQNRRQSLFILDSTLEFMSREIRLGTDFRCLVGRSERCEVFRFSLNGTPITYDFYRGNLYRTYNNVGREVIVEEDIVGVDITSTFFEIVNKDDEDKDVQPYVTIKLDAEYRIKKGEALKPITLNTSITQRKLNLSGLSRGGNVDTNDLFSQTASSGSVQAIESVNNTVYALGANEKIYTISTNGIGDAVDDVLGSYADNNNKKLKIHRGASGTITYLQKEGGDNKPKLYDRPNATGYEVNNGETLYSGTYELLTFGRLALRTKNDPQGSRLIYLGFAGSTARDVIYNAIVSDLDGNVFVLRGNDNQTSWEFIAPAATNSSHNTFDTTEVEEIELERRSSLKSVEYSIAGRIFALYNSGNLYSIDKSGSTRIFERTEVYGISSNFLSPDKFVALINGQCNPSNMDETSAIKICFGSIDSSGDVNYRDIVGIQFPNENNTFGSTVGVGPFHSDEGSAIAFDSRSFKDVVSVGSGNNHGAVILDNQGRLYYTRFGEKLTNLIGIQGREKVSGGGWVYWLKDYKFDS